MLTVVGVIAVMALIVATGYFVAGEFAFVAVRRGRLEAQAAAGDHRSGRAVEVHRRLSFMLSGAQLGITVTSLAVGFIAEPTLGRTLEPVVSAVGVPERARAGVAVSVGFVLATVVSMVVGELAPKNLAIARPESVAKTVAGSTLVFLRIASPLIRLFDGSANRLLRAVGIEPAEELHGSVSVDELDLIVEESAHQGKLTAAQAALLARALGFRGLRAAQAMVPWNRVTTLPATATGDDLRAAMATAHSRFPVVADDGTVTGVVHAKSLLGVPAHDRGGIPVVQLARRPLVVPESASLRAVLAELRRETTEMAVVVDEYGAPAGVVTLEDLVEELVGDIDDEHDPDRPGAEQDVTGAWLVPGEWRLDETERAIGITLPQEGDYDTIAGLVLAHLQRLAQPGDRIDVAGTRIDVVAVDGWTVTRVRLSPHPTQAATEADDHTDPRAEA